MAQEKLTDENQRYIIDWLNDKNNGQPYFLLKFCQEERFAKDICAGNLFANTPKWFRDKENESGVRGQGDAYELILPLQFHNMQIRNPETKEVICELENVRGRFQIKDDDIKPLVSFVGITINDMIPARVTENEASFRFPFTKEEFEHMADEFGPYCVIISEKYLRQKISKYAEFHNVDYIFDAVRYRKSNSSDRIQAYGSEKSERFLYKNDDLKYQREYRLAFAMNMPKDHFIRVGSLGSAASYIEANKLQDAEIVLPYKKIL